VRIAFQKVPKISGNCFVTSLHAMTLTLGLVRSGIFESYLRESTLECFTGSPACRILIAHNFEASMSGLDFFWGPWFLPRRHRVYGFELRGMRIMATHAPVIGIFAVPISHPPVRPDPLLNQFDVQGSDGVACTRIMPSVITWLLSERALESSLHWAYSTFAAISTVEGYWI
jgi:hypothetical protein